MPQAKTYATGLITAALLAGVLSALAGCGSEGTTTGTPIATDVQSGGGDPLDEIDDPSDDHAKRISAADYPDDVWPLAAKAGVVRCKAGSVTFQTRSGNEYAVNGTAKTRFRNVMQPINAIWLSDPHLPSMKIDISPVLDTGLDLC